MLILFQTRRNNILSEVQHRSGFSELTEKILGPEHRFWCQRKRKYLSHQGMNVTRTTGKNRNKVFKPGFTMTQHSGSVTCGTVLHPAQKWQVGYKCCWIKRSQSTVSKLHGQFNPSLWSTVWRKLPHLHSVKEFGMDSPLITNQVKHCNRSKYVKHSCGSRLFNRKICSCLWQCSAVCSIPQERIQEWICHTYDNHLNRGIGWIECTWKTDSWFPKCCCLPK